MMRQCFKNLSTNLSLSLLVACLVFGQNVCAQQSEAKATLFLSPRLETVLAGSIFDISVFLDTHGSSINAVELRLKFSADKLRIVKPSDGKSFFATWHEVPTYSNEEGIASFVGGIPNGIATESGLITNITFEAKETGRAVVEVLPSSKVLANDGQGTNILQEFGKGLYAVEPRPPEGPKVYSETHPFEDRWYNNNNPILLWEKEAGVSDFSFELDNKPSTIPDNNPDAPDTIKAYEGLGNGIWYFHIKSRKEGVWGTTTHFPLRIDTEPPLAFKPRIEILTAAIINRALVHFSTTDLLSGMDHYEVGIIEKEKSPESSPVFLRAESPYQLPLSVSGNLLLIVRAIDRAGNVRDESIDLAAPFSLKNIYIAITVGIFVLFLLLLIGYLIGRRFRKLPSAS